jgi:bifunctional enzyme CysN/CysC
MPVQYVLRQSAEFRGYSGRIASGILRVGDEVRLLPSGRSSRIKSIIGPEGELGYAFPPQSVTVSLEDEIDVSRGAVLVHPQNLPVVGRELEAILVWMDEAPFRPGKPYIIKHCTRQVRGQFTRLNYRIEPEELHRGPAEELQLNEIGRVELELYQPIAYDEYTRNRTTGSFIVIDPLTNGTVGAGVIITRFRGRGSAGRSKALASPASRNITPHRGLVPPERRHLLLRQKPVTLWFTGLSSSGKSTIALNLEKRLIDEGHPAYVLDGDNIRVGLNRDLGFSASDRTENIRRISEVAALFNESGMIVLTAFISPYREDRSSAREIVGEEHFVEIFVDAPVEVCEARDPKGLYRRARSGEIAEFTGISAPYEAPDTPQIHLETARQSVEECVELILRYLKEKGFLASG